MKPTAAAAAAQKQANLAQTTEKNSAEAGTGTLEPSPPGPGRPTTRLVRKQTLQTPEITHHGWVGPETPHRFLQGRQPETLTSRPGSHRTVNGPGSTVRRGASGAGAGAVRKPGAHSRRLPQVSSRAGAPRPPPSALHSRAPTAQNLANFPPRPPPGSRPPASPRGSRVAGQTP